jgi:hypothetical protein
MLTYLVTRGHRYTMDTYLESWGGPAGEIRVLTYEDVFRFGEVPLGPCTFSDLERLSPAETRLGVHIWNRLSQANPTGSLWNHQQGALRRYDLLRALRSAGWNDFQVYRATEPRKLLRFPVFIRQENEHHGGLTLCSARSKRSAELCKASWSMAIG